jgi:excisionase family DNA binding protein
MTDPAHQPVPELERMLTVAEVAALFRVDPKTVARWANDGKLRFIRTLGGHRRYYSSQVYALLYPAPAGPSPDDTNAVPESKEEG